jgi:predicted metal-dependent hydrolase
MNDLHRKAIQGLNHLNRGEFFTAHEYFEDAWRGTSDDTREFYRALLHISGGYYRLSQGKPAAARKFFTRAIHWMETFPTPYSGLDTAMILFHLSSLVQAIDNEKTCETILEHFPPHIVSNTHRESQ